MNACERCGRGDATIQYTEVNRGEVSRMSLCRRCAETQGLLSDLSEGGVDALISDLSRTGETEAVGIRVTQAACPTCGTSWREHQTSGELGCEDCYKTFAMQLTRLLREKHQAPLQGAPGRRRASDPSALLPELRSLLDQAVREEDYESAAKLRDRIQQLESPPRAEGGSGPEGGAPDEEG